MKCLLIIPAYNEEASIARVVDQIKKDYSQFDYIVINDGSVDRTQQVCEQNEYKVITHPVNLGLAGAFQTGMRYAYEHGYDCAIQFDADGQHLPEFVEKMMEAMEERGYGIVIGSRFLRKKKNRSFRMLGNTLIGGAIRLTTGRRLSDPTSGMRLYGKEVMQEFAAGLNYGPEPDTISFLIKRGVSVGEVQVDMEERKEGSSYLTLTKSISYMARMLISILLIQGVRVRARRQ